MYAQKYYTPLRLFIKNWHYETNNYVESFAYFRISSILVYFGTYLVSGGKNPGIKTLSKAITTPQNITTAAVAVFRPSGDSNWRPNAKIPILHIHNNIHVYFHFV